FSHPEWRGRNRTGEIPPSRTRSRAADLFRAPRGTALRLRLEPGASQLQHLDVPSKSGPDTTPEPRRRSSHRSTFAILACRFGTARSLAARSPTKFTSYRASRPGTVHALPPPRNATDPGGMAMRVFVLILMLPLFAACSTVSTAPSPSAA